MAAAAEAFRHDPARDAEVDAAAVRWLPPGFAPVDVGARDATRTGQPQMPDADATAPDPSNGVPAEAPATGESAGSAPENGDAVTAAESGDDNGAADSQPENGALPAFLTS